MIYQLQLKYLQASTRIMMKCMVSVLVSLACLSTAVAGLQCVKQEPHSDTTEVEICPKSYDFCKRITHGDGEEERGCSKELKEVDTELLCQPRLTDLDVPMDLMDKKVCQCKKDLCNASFKIIPGVTTILAIVIAAVYC